ncbi:DUF768 domain-containing protein [Mesorhizobium sp. CO1-1-7]|uniref:DUF768 domain-containing protein n=1 Tax=unclassified Mesorhizobium TaxID=325217 RepID=UPI0011288E15|nr:MULTISPECIES: DUF768 domain-containing protein [unclassified Mesorhizobium]MBZ9747832.1 DUF768 domain-containing protein [Mesorhizobium sp. CO1-1-7]TPJ12143.1 DUF768 domain-containing protein [Mesorhizobium sp. B2-7-3]TPL74314.1 DUF768 domain-containing protein [Mesorhizobium sp. B2-3-15]TPL99529.1 DUF768 domain-containing protein [Mesorhizobium sp. B2-3-10]
MRRLLLKNDHTRANFLDRWMAEHLPDAVTDDPGAINDLADHVMEAADREGIAVSKIYEEVDSAFEVIAKAMQHRDGSLAIADRRGRGQSVPRPVLRPALC